MHWLKNPRTDTDNFLQNRLELKETVLRSLIISVGITGSVIYAASNLTAFWSTVPQLSMIIGVLALTTIVSFRQIEKSITLARCLWLIGITLTVLCALFIFPSRNTIFLFTLIPSLVLLSSLSLGWSIFSSLIFIFLFVSLRQFSSFSFITVDDIAMMAILHILSLGATWGVFRAILQNSEWAMANYRKTREEVESLRGERLIWKQMKEDYELITREMARLTDRLEAMTQIAEEARRAKEEFVAIVSHELRTPLNMIIGFSEVIMKSPQIYGDSIPPALLADIAAIERNSQHLSKLVDDVLDLSQIDTGRISLSKDWVNLREIIEQAFSVVRFLFESKGLYLRSEIPEQLPLVFCDSTRIRQVLINLLSNAGRFTEQGRVVVSGEIKENRIILSVTDTGPGIPDEFQEKIFEPFFQIHSYLNGHKGGSGLGLSICKQFVEMHHGKMWLKSKVGQGTTFYFELPVNDLSDRNTHRVQRWFNPYFQYELRRPSRVTLPNLKARYVVLEEDGTLQKYLKRHVGSSEVISVKNIEEAIEEIKKSPADALIQNLPVSHSIPNEDELAQLPYGTPVINCWIPGKGDAIQKMGIVDYLVKPLKRDELLSAIRKTLKKPDGVILLVDDEPEILQLYSRILNTEIPSLHIIQAMNGQRALYMMRERQPDLVLLDLLMPGKDGSQVLMEKSQDEKIKGIPVIVISSRSPSGEASLSNRVTVFRASGFSMRDLAHFIQQTSHLLTPSKRSAAPGHGKKPLS